MKGRIDILFIVIFGIFQVPFAQTDTTNCPSIMDTLTGQEIYTFVDKQPTPKGGEKRLYEELKNVNIGSRCMNIDKRIIVAFIVGVNGEIRGKRVLKDFEGNDYAAQVLRLMNNIEWSAAMCNGKLVPAIRKVSVRIYL